MNTSVLNIKSHHLRIRVRLGKKMSINKKVFHALDDPKYIQFWWSKSQKVILIGEAPEKTSLSFVVNDNYYDKKTGFKIEKNKFIQTIMKLSEWRSDMIYTVTGEYISELNMVAFKLDNAVELKVAFERQEKSDVI